MKKKKKSKKVQQMIRNIAFSIEAFLSENKEKPFSKQQISKRLNLPKSLRPFLAEAIALLIKEKTIEYKKGKYTYIYKKGKVVQGILRLHPRGFGFVKTETTEDIFIPPDSLLGAIDEDIVEVEINPIPSVKGLDGEIIEIVERKRKTLVGTIFQATEKRKSTRYLVFVPLLGKDRSVVLKTKESLKIGDRVLMKIEHWNEEIICSLQKFLGRIDDASKDIEIAKDEYSLPKSFSKEAEKEAKKFGRTLTQKDKSKREDLTALDCITIDPKTAKDFDDAISLTKDNKGYHLGVHIADVAHYVKKGSALDKEALNRANSTYFPGSVIPMLPFALSSHLCSLMPNEERLAATIFMDFDKQGNQKGYRIVRSVIKSKKRFSYEEAFAVLEKKKKSPFEKQLKQMKELALLLKKKRIERGSFDFALPEAAVEVDKKGIPTAIVIHEYDISHQMIEEFMLKANETIAQHLSEKKKYLIYRIHEPPAEENLQSFFSLARAVGFDLSKKPKHKEVQSLFEAAKETAFGRELAVQFIKSMKMAFYSRENIGHYGLALTHYCHFTSPIRRYSDLIAARLLFEGEKEMNIQEIALHCSERERRSMQAETSVIRLKKLRLLYYKWKENPHMLYEATITGVKPFGLIFDVQDYYFEGFVHVSKLDDFYMYDDKNQTLKAKHSKKKYLVGDTIAVYLHNVDLIMLTTDWTLEQL